MEIQKKLDEASNLYKEVETKIKKIEMMGEDLAIPAVNELRYAGCHFTRAWVCLDQDPDKAEQEIDSAVNHIKRAGYDCIEIGILFQAENFRAFQNLYRDVEITPVFPEYIEMCDLFEKTKDAVVKCEKESRGELWKRMEGALDKMIPFTKKLTIIEEELKKKIRAEIRAEEKQNRRFILSLTIPAVIAIVIGLLGLLQIDVVKNWVGLPTTATQSPAQLGQTTKVTTSTLATIRQSTPATPSPSASTKTKP